MVSRTITLTGTGDELSVICTPNPARVVLGVRNESTTVNLYVSDTSGFGFFLVEPGGMLVLLASDGYDLTQAWYAYWEDLGTYAVPIMEEFLSNEVMRKLQMKGIDSTAGLAFLVAVGVLS